MIDTRSPQALIAELGTLEHRLKRAKDECAFRHVHAQLNQLRYDIRDTTPLAKAKYYFVRALAYAKPARMNKAGFLKNSTTECLEYAFELFEDARDAIRLEASEHGMSPTLRVLEQHCAYEAAAVLTVLDQWGAVRNRHVDIEVLSSHTQRKIEKALKHNYSLSSQF